MGEMEPQVAILIADIAGSTPLYEAAGNAEAARRIRSCLARLREIVAANGGTFVSSKGDDVLAVFDDAGAALAAAERIMAGTPAGGLSLHAGLHFGEVVSAGGNMYGDAINLAARLAAKANSGEVLASREFVARLAPARASSLRRLSEMACKGKALPVEVYALDDDTPLRTEVLFIPARQPTADGAAPDAGLSVTLGFGGDRHVIGEGCSLSLGRAPENDVVVARPWVSRRHATVAVSRGRVQLTDRSSYGCYVVDAQGHEFVALRETVILTGTGRISLGTSATAPDAAVIRYEVGGAPKPQGAEAKGGRTEERG